MIVSWDEARQMITIKGDIDMNDPHWGTLLIQDISKDESVITMMGDVYRHFNPQGLALFGLNREHVKQIFDLASRLQAEERGRPTTIVYGGSLRQ